MKLSHFLWKLQVNNIRQGIGGTKSLRTLMLENYFKILYLEDVSSNPFYVQLAGGWIMIQTHRSSFQIQNPPPTYIHSAILYFPYN